MKKEAKEILNLLYGNNLEDSILEEIDARLWCLFNNMVFRPKYTGVFWVSTSETGWMRRLTNVPRYSTELNELEKLNKEHDIEIIMDDSKDLLCLIADSIREFESK